MAGFLRFNNNAFTGKKFQSGNSFTPSHKLDNKGPFQDPAPKGYLLTKFDAAQRSGHFAPLVRFMFNNNKKIYESNEYVSDSTSTVKRSQLISPILAWKGGKVYHCEWLIRNSDHAC